MASVVATLPSTLNAVKVIIHGGPDFHAYVDLASFSIYDGTSSSVSEGKVSLAVNLWHFSITSGLTYDGLARLSCALDAQSIHYHYFGDRIIDIQLKVELLPNDGSSTSQAGQLTIRYVGQANDKGYEIDPAVQEQFQNNILASASLAIKVLIGAGLAIASGPNPPAWVVIAKTVTAPVAGIAVDQLLKHFASDADDKNAYGGADFSVHEYWGYPVIDLEPIGPDHFVVNATGHYEFDWAFATSSSSQFQIRVTAIVAFGYIWVEPNTGIRYLYYANTATVSRVVTINA